MVKAFIKSIFAFQSDSEILCSYCVEMVRKWNFAFTEGSKIRCTGCDNSMVLRHLKSTTSDIDEQISFGVTKDLSDSEIVPEYMELDRRVHDIAYFDDVCKKYSLGDDWKSLQHAEDHIIAFKKTSLDPSDAEIFYAPFNGGVLYVSQRKP